MDKERLPLSVQCPGALDHSSIRAIEGLAASGISFSQLIEALSVHGMIYGGSNPNKETGGQVIPRNDRGILPHSKRK